MDRYIERERGSFVISKNKIYNTVHANLMEYLIEIIMENIMEFLIFTFHRDSL